MHYGSGPEERNKWMSGFPSYLDQNQNYVTGAFDTATRGVFFGARNPFSAYASNNLEVTRNADVWGTYSNRWSHMDIEKYF